MSDLSFALTRKRPRAGLVFLGTIVVASGVLGTYLVVAVQKARNAASESQLL